MQLIAFVSYLFDAYPPQATLSALTACAVTRVASAGWVPLVITYDIMDLGGNLALGAIFGSIAVAFFLIIPFGLLFFGAKLRSKSGYARKYAGMAASPATMECQGSDCEKESESV